ncbi:MAG TPA: hypothetical protein VMV33_17290 [Rhodocyclaceae bacterium]|nr:hypothetical protein [Rhodocyclaceae bacterium]
MITWERTGPRSHRVVIDRRSDVERAAEARWREMERLRGDLLRNIWTDGRVLRLLGACDAPAPMVGRNPGAGLLGGIFGGLF